MQLETDLRTRLLRLGLLDRAGYKEAGFMGNRLINGNYPDPFAAILDDLEGRGIDRAVLEREFAETVAGSSAISYIHLGRPETLLLDTHKRLAEAEAELMADDRVLTALSS